MYDRTCRHCSPDDIARLDAAGTPRAIRLHGARTADTSFTDLVHGPIAFDNSNIEDFVVLRSDGQPTYHLSVVADDIDMAITHVVRGDDHISNTPKQVLLYQALGHAVPAFAHVPLILGTDKKRLSKRHGATSVTEYARLGYLPEAMVNFLALLGWSPGDDRELLSRDELISAFALEGISGGNAVFNPEKLDWINQQYIMRLSTEELGARLEPYLRDAGLWREEFAAHRRSWYLALVELFKPRLTRLTKFAEEAGPFLTAEIVTEESAARKYSEAGARHPVAGTAVSVRCARPVHNRSHRADSPDRGGASHAQTRGPDPCDARRCHRSRRQPRSLRGARDPGPPARRPKDDRCSRAISPHRVTTATRSCEAGCTGKFLPTCIATLLGN